MKLIREHDDFSWVDEIQINPWLGYDTINFDIVPSEEDVNKYIELALSTKKIENSGAWAYSREYDIEKIIQYAERGSSYLSIDKNNVLSYGNESYYPKDTKKINYSSLIGKPLNEEDEWDWIRDTQPWISFEEAQIGQRYNIEKDEVLLDALNACGLWDYMYHNSVTAEVTGKGYNKYSNIHCGSENGDEVITLKLTFYDEQDKGIDEFWVTEDMVTLYPIYDNINESSDENPFQWIKDIPAGIELEPNTLYYFEPPLTRGEIPLFADTIQNSNHIKAWLLNNVMNYLTKTRNIGVKYFVTNDNLESNIGGWCTETDIDYAKRLYYGQKPVDARKRFGL